MDIRSIRDEIGATYERMKQRVEAAQAADTPLTGEQEEHHTRDEARLSALIKMRDEAYALLEAQTAAMDKRAAQIATMAQERGGGSALERRIDKGTDSEQYRSAWVHYLVGGYRNLSEMEQRALAEGTDSAGGFLPVTEFYTTLIEKRLQANAMRQVADIIPMGSFKTDIPIEATLASAGYVDEAGAATDNTGTFGNVILSPNTLRAFCKVSNELLADAPSRGPAFNIQTILASQMGRSMGAAEEAAFTTGNGSGKPKGIFTYTTAGTISSIADFETAAVGTVTMTDLVNCIYALPRQYRANAKWVMADATFGLIRRMTQTVATNATGTSYAPFAWSLGDGRLGDNGEPDRLLGYPVVCVSNAPAFGNGARIAVFGDTSYYKIGEREGISVKVASETFLANNQTGYFGFARHDGKMTLGESCVYLEVKAS